MQIKNKVQNMIKKIGMYSDYTNRRDYSDFKKKALKVAAFALVAGGGVAAFALLRGRGRLLNDVFESKKANLAPLILEDKHKPVAAIEDKLKQGTKMYLANNGTLVDVKKKGAYVFNTDNSPFSGVMKTLNSQGEITVEYHKGKISKSYINGELFKEYRRNKVDTVFIETGEPGESFYSKSITQYEKGKKAKEYCLNYSLKGKLKRFFVSDYVNDTCHAVDFSQEGRSAIKMRSKYYSANHPWLVRQDIYDEFDGSYLQRIKYTSRGKYKITDMKTQKQEMAYCLHPFSSAYSESSEIYLEPIEAPNKLQQAARKISDIFRKK